MYRYSCGEVIWSEAEQITVGFLFQVEDMLTEKKDSVSKLQTKVQRLDKDIQSKKEVSAQNGQIHLTGKPEATA